ncbi:hypothetical protein AYO43_09615 [Nitrospira sp. SCGC AG-212-E16]|nr:hypothetical protein AYO43_09615 [Nitrospira sp. SCGC AG-212-E16]
MEFLKNIVVNLQATGPAAVLAIWVICVTVLGIFGSGPMASLAFGILSFFGGAVIFGLTAKIQ